MGHDLVVIGGRLRRELGSGLWPESLDGPAQRLALHYTASQCPDAFPEGTPSDHYGPELSEQALADAATLVAATDEAWGRLLATGEAE